MTDTPAQDDNWLDVELEYARREYEKWPEWMKAASRTREWQNKQEIKP